ncbi:4-hydroxy-tetrahydrodipicolinate synthase [Glaciimonas sp. CA11.2]|uniref:4-hydroxy-tetrahydrodipicolinate synthase n=1 Tax=unclassified Glaciimonas TaxID=2644401 RepID=UPI002AB4FBC1|nr:MULTISPECIES: 4-hydroxy-tetrahydrodipicolinate synthase [unclassified Glaciimonas]MDY7547599.1 4-hydroxy-tetrahydrodipicolinate synthase [Glaciimonas sp. CA11.2]MEB0014453.1 4-hydroxy-tetrahydrodipicolinate synthase [Glaciimonas sp. Cout2]MEB0084781.1 4-hydroxy-tetrahydrodipicolinate synthase [Glaciimonas sp. Gout2]MEB0162463.1 4-hydroxy-tetrahydrodipicolinate synthase [Glaciimonas sp. CA11.2]
MKFTANGIYTAIVTPFTANDEFDEKAFRKLIDFQVDEGAGGLLVVGGSGEYVSLTPSERKKVVEVSVDQVRGRIPIIVGALAPATREVLDTAKHAADAGADAVLVLPPYYIKPSADGIVEHFAAIADGTSLPIVAYNNTGRTGLTLDIPILERLTKLPSIVALKECERDLAVVSAKIKAVGERIAVMSGDDDLGFPTFLLGSPGGIFMTANLVPAFHKKLFEATKRGDIANAKKAHYALLALVEALYTANHPGPLKDAMAYVGQVIGAARSPLQHGSAESLKRAKAAIETLQSLVF